jgi:cytochrome c-type biogenesis protein CcmH
VIRIIALWLSLTAAALAVSNPVEMLPDPAQEARARALGQQLRCLVCQNNSVEESEADFARDLRRVIRERVKAGESDAQVMAWMTARYGEFVRLNPVLSVHTLLLWASPVLAMLLGVGAMVLSRRRRVIAPAPLSEAERATLGKLLDP